MSYAIRTHIVQTCLGVGTSRTENDSNLTSSVLWVIASICNKNASPEVVLKTKFIAKTLHEDKAFDGRNILCCLALHSSACPVMKEIGVRQAYSILANNALPKDTSILPCILKILYETRESCLEKQYTQKIIQNGAVNMHGMIGYRNLLA